MKAAIDATAELYTAEHEWQHAETLHAVIAAEWQNVYAQHPILGQLASTSVGWWPILMQIAAVIERTTTEHPGFQIKILQIKEKFGGLRFYYSTSRTDAISDEEYEELCATISEAVQAGEIAADAACEVCGEPGERRSTRWIKTVCDKHFVGDKR